MKKKNNAVRILLSNSFYNRLFPIQDYKHGHKGSYRQTHRFGKTTVCTSNSHTRHKALRDGWQDQLNKNQNKNAPEVVQVIGKYSVCNFSETLYFFNGLW